MLAGINLPMLVKLAKVRDECPLPEAVRRRRKRAANTSPSPAACWPANERADGDSDARPMRRAAPGAIVRVLQIVNQQGLHARASAKFVQTVEQFEAEVRVTRGGETVGGTSIMGLMMLAAAPGTRSRSRRRPAGGGGRWRRWRQLAGRARFGEDD